jgi:23S rRNA G2445 N2-methylase RlmL
MPGLGRLLAAEINKHPDLAAEDEIGHDGRADIVRFTARRGARWAVDQLRLAEDVFVVIAQAPRRGTVSQLAGALAPRGELERALSVYARFVRHLAATMSFRAIVRVLDESAFRRTDLRSAMVRAIGAARPKWKAADPADVEIWVVEHRSGQVLCGLRLSDKRLRQHGAPRAVERHGALRPVVAAAMVSLAGGPPGTLLDPCCGSGTILSEAMAVGWDASGSDIDPDAVSIAAANAPKAAISPDDVTTLSQPDASVDAVVSNLPFGKQFEGAGVSRNWRHAALAEMSRATRVGGRVVVLVPPPVPRSLPGLRLVESHPIRLLGVPTRIWVFDRVAP